MSIVFVHFLDQIQIKQVVFTSLLFPVKYIHGLTDLITGHKLKTGRGLFRRNLD